MIGLFPVGCGGALYNNPDKNGVSSHAASVESAPDLSDRIEYDEAGNVKSVKGLSTDSGVNDLPQVGEDDERLYEILKENLRRDDPVVVFDSPEGTTSEFSVPVMVSGASLRLAPFQDCRLHSYIEEAPSVRSVTERALSAKTCGPVSMQICVRNYFNDDQNTIKNYAHISLPIITIPIPCEENDFKQSTVKINGGAEYTNDINVKVNVSPGSHVNRYAVSNSDNCISSQGWQPIPASGEDDWILSVSGTPEKATVYYKFMDVLNRSSACFSTSILVCDENAGFHWDSGSLSCKTSPSTSSSTPAAETTTTVTPELVSISDNKFRSGESKQLTVLAKGMSASGGNKILLGSKECESVAVTDVAGDVYTLTCNVPQSTAIEKVIVSLQNDDGGTAQSSVNFFFLGAPKVWLDAQSSETMFDDAGCTVAISGSEAGCWQDKSGNNNHATHDRSPTPETGTWESAINSKKAILFDRTWEAWKFSSSINLHESSFFIVAKARQRNSAWEDSGLFGNGLDGGVTNYFQLALGSMSTTGEANNSFFSGAMGIDQSKLANPILVSYHVSSDKTLNYYTNQSHGYTSSVLTSNTMIVDHLGVGHASGDDRWFEGHIGEVIIYGTLNDAERVTIEEYLMNHWELSF